MTKQYTVDDVPDHNNEYCVRTFEDGVQVGNSWRQGKEARDAEIAFVESEGYVRKRGRMNIEPVAVAQPQPWLR